MTVTASAGVNYCTMHLAVSTPTVSTTVPSGPLFIGVVDNTTLTCSAMLGGGVDNPAVIRYNYTWVDRDGREIVSGGRTIITPTTPSTSSSSTLTLSPLSTTDTNFTESHSVIHETYCVPVILENKELMLMFLVSTSVY